MLVAGLLAADSSLLGAGFTEPPITFYGQVSQTADGYTVPLNSGTITWTIQPATPSGATPLVLSAALGSSGPTDPAFYRLKVPVEKVPAGSTVSTGAISATSSTASYSRGTVKLNGSLPLQIQVPSGPAANSFNFSESSRGKIERVDLLVSGPFSDSDSDGMPDWFEDRYGLDKSDPSDATRLDAFGRKYLLDYQNHITPTDSQMIEYQLWCQARNLTGACAAVEVDPDNDGVNNLMEFALDTKPMDADAALSRQRAQTTVETVSGKRYLTLTINKPGRSSVAYKVESSSDMQTWGSAEGVDVTTVTSNGSTLQVRDFHSLDEAGAQRRFIRLKVQLNP